MAVADVGHKVLVLGEPRDGRPRQVDLLDGAVALEEPLQRRPGRPRGQVGQEELPKPHLMVQWSAVTVTAVTVTAVTVTIAYGDSFGNPQLALHVVKMGV